MKTNPQFPRDSTGGKFSPDKNHVGLWILAMVCLGLLFLRSQFLLSLTLGSSMLPTLSSGDLLLLDKHAYRSSPPKRGDLVVVRFHHEWMVKRIVGLPGEEIELLDGRLYIDRILKPEQHPIAAGPMNIARGRLSLGKFAVLGDNRAMESSQTVHAVIRQGDIVGKVLLSFPLKSTAGCLLTLP